MIGLWQAGLVPFVGTPPCYTNEVLMYAFRFKRFFNAVRSLFVGKATTSANDDDKCISCLSPGVQRVGDELHCGACGYISTYDPIGVSDEDVASLHRLD